MCPDDFEKTSWSANGQPIRAINGTCMRQKRITRIQSNSRGFTLAELLTVMAVLAIFAGIAVPNYVAVQPGLQLNGAAREVLGKLMWARSKAVAQNNQWVVTFPTNHSFQILDDTNNNGTADAGESTQTIDINTAYPNVTISKSGSDPTFNSRGTAGGSTTITITNTSGAKTVTVSGTGNVKIN